MLAFLRKNQIVLTSLGFLTLSLYLLIALSSGYLKSEPFGPLLLEFLKPWQRGSQATLSAIGNVNQNIVDLFNLSSENERLKRRLVEIEAERNRLLEADATNRQLRSLLDLKNQMPRQSIGALVVASSASTWFQSIVINKGTKEGVRKGMAVISPLGTVGQITAASPHAAKVLLLTDSRSGIEVVVQRSRARGIVSGSLDNGPIMKYVKRSEDVRVGDSLVTSGLDGIFPKGLIVGRVNEVRKKHFGLFQYVGVTLAVDASDLEEVLVVSPENSSVD